MTSVTGEMTALTKENEELHAQLHWPVLVRMHGFHSRPSGDARDEKNDDGKLQFS
jgi:hypothetical protein